MPKKALDLRYQYLTDVAMRYLDLIPQVDKTTHSTVTDRSEKSQIREEAVKVLADLIALSALCNIDVPQQKITTRMNDWLVEIHGHDVVKKVQKAKRK